MMRLLKNYRRKNRRHVYLAVGANTPSRVASLFKEKRNLTGVVVNVTPDTTVERLESAIAQHAVCIFLIRVNRPRTTIELRELMRQHHYSQSLLELVNEIYSINSDLDNYALAA